jgi:phenylpyruvate tautomerase PptA (4-oxalocrotonate tautomerase family)
MPTYAFTTMKSLTQDQRARIVESVTAIHSEEGTAPRYFVQVVFYDVGPGAMFIGGGPAPESHVWVRADIRAGRTKEQKAAIMRRLMQASSEILNVSTENVWIYISDIPAEGVTEFGAVLPPPGGEEKWLASLPPALREKLRAAT